MSYTGDICNGAHKSPNLCYDQLPLKFGSDAKSLPWGSNIRGESLEGPRPGSWWTGRPPVYMECPGVLPNGKMTSLPLPNANAGGFTRQSIIDYFNNTWTLTEVLFSALQSEEAFYRPPYHELRHPLVFYYVHPAVFYINKFRVAGLIDESIDLHVEQLFEVGVDEMSWDDMSKNNESWPSIKECTEYRRKAYQKILEVLENHPDLTADKDVTRESKVWAVFMAPEHERIHIETSSVLFRELPLSLLQCPSQWPDVHVSAPAESSSTPAEDVDYPKNEFVEVLGSDVELGRGDHADSYGWDNEFGMSKFQVKNFAASKFLCSNGEFWQFVTSGGYSNESLWTEDGWKWKKFFNAKWPTFWVPFGPQGLHRYKLRVVFGIIEMPWKFPVVVNAHEAAAYCKWLSNKIQKPCRLPTEGEHHLMRDSSLRNKELGPQRDLALRLNGSELVKNVANLSLGAATESAVDFYPPASTGIYDVMGNVWEWCVDWFAPLEGFKVHPYYEDFSTPCFDNKHQSIIGGSFISTGNEASIWARFHFRSHFFQHAGFRVVVADGTHPLTVDQLSRKQTEKYSKRDTLNQYLNFHFGSKDEICNFSFVPQEFFEFPQRCARLVIDACKTHNVQMKTALDLGCAVGATSFELAREFDSVLGIDLSTGLIQAAEDLKANRTVSYECREEGELSRPLVAAVDEAIDRSRVTFKEADACCLPPGLGSFDAVIAANLLCRLPSPKACLSRMGGLKGIVAKGGILVLVTPFSWFEEYTAKGSWLGGYVDNGRKVYSEDTLVQFLSEEFELLERKEVPAVIRSHNRFFELCIPLATIWRRKL